MLLDTAFIQYLIKQSIYMLDNKGYVIILFWLIGGSTTIFFISNQPKMEWYEFS